MYYATFCCNLILQAALDKMSKGHMLADAVAIIGKHLVTEKEAFTI